jgi:hypothetical protein
MIHPEGIKDGWCIENKITRRTGNGALRQDLIQSRSHHHRAPAAARILEYEHSFVKLLLSLIW